MKDTITANYFTIYNLTVGSMFHINDLRINMQGLTYINLFMS